MLCDEAHKRYVVCPSWLELPIPWLDFRHEMEHPSDSRILDPETDVSDLKFPEDFESGVFIDGPVGGGIIYADSSLPSHRWLPLHILRRDNDITMPTTMIHLLGKVQCKVGYVEPRNEPFGVRRKIYPVGATVEHVSVADSEIYWVLGERTTKRRSHHTDAVSVASGFQLVAQPLSDAPPHIHEKTHDWFTNPEYTFYWYKLTTNVRALGYLFAVTLYTGLHLSYVSRRRIRFIHLLSELETPVNWRATWRHR